MLKCVYHPLDPFRVVEDDEADRLMASGVWFDSPLKARAYRENVEKEIQQTKPKKEKNKATEK